MTDDVRYLDHDGERIAYRLRAGAGPTLLFLPGYMSDMDGAKAAAVAGYAEERGLGCVRFDYSGNGQSSGPFEDGTLARWLEDALAVVDRRTDGPLILVGSSMGGWLALHIALSRPERIRGIVGIAAAPDFTEWGFGSELRAQLARDGKIDEVMPDGTRGRYFTNDFWQSGQDMLLLGGALSVDCPVRLVHGDEDSAVPLEVSHRLMERLRSADVQLTIVKGGGHRLSAPHEIAAIVHALAGLLEVVH
ncbi:alpha/beta hydrolase [Sphingomonas piscis]|uniref:Palmitoyl-protein thioesterase ABHD10, mitochondrial n=1 Tax=Sphingomonas piscis TaxID=2714943 RepID=A0A6G7YP79_9SPHN|nr:alpha/beta hydrolase [Sphingomonas piscis]QIK78544.1 alpha/beta hydrolase [Sphingomonas piscis]